MDARRPFHLLDGGNHVEQWLENVSRGGGRAALYQRQLRVDLESSFHQSHRILDVTGILKKWRHAGSRAREYREL